MSQKIFIDEDDKKYLQDFSEEFLVVCPQCGNCAKVSIKNSVGDSKIREILELPRRVVCLTCPYNNVSDNGSFRSRNQVDWYFKLPLWLQISCRGENLWAFNLRHLNFLEDYVGASLRYRTPNQNNSIPSRLPRWMTDAKNRDAVLKCISKLKIKVSQ